MSTSASINLTNETGVEPRVVVLRLGDHTHRPGAAFMCVQFSGNADVILPGFDEEAAIYAWKLAAALLTAADSIPPTSRTLDTGTTANMDAEAMIAQIEGGGNLPVEANARLIAAAPELLDALKDAIATIRTWHNMGHYAGEADRVWSLYQQSPEMKRLNAAIANAEGTDRSLMSDSDGVLRNARRARVRTQ